MSLLEQEPLWIVPFVFIILFMVHAMVQYVLSLMVKRPAVRRKVVPAAEMKTRLERINAAEQPYKLKHGLDWDYELQWQVVDAEWRKRFARINLTSLYRARLLLDETKREVRLQEHMRSSSFFLGFQGWIPRFRWRWSAYWGPMKGQWSGRAFGLGAGSLPQIGEVVDFSIDTDAAREAITKIANGGGWAVRPVILQYQISRKWQRRLQRLTPGPVLRLQDRHFWAIMYPGSYVAAIAYLFLISGRTLGEPANLAILLLVSASWWGIWGLLTWVLLRMPEQAKKRQD